MPEHELNLVAPLGHKPTAMRTTDTARPRADRSGAVSALVGIDLRGGDVDSAHTRRDPPTTRSPRTSSTATATTTTRTTSSACALSADPNAAPTMEELVRAWVDCRRHKRNTDSARLFELNIERNLSELLEQLVSQAYRPGRSICFVVTRPKAREVWAADFRDRVVHHLLYNRIAPYFHTRFSAASCACIPGRGTLYAAQRLEHDIRAITQNWSRPAHYLKCDLANFFVSIDKRILQAQLHAHIAPGWARWLADTILMHDPRTDFELHCSSELLGLVPPHKRLVNAPIDTGLPIGNLSSQFFANVLLDALDQHVKHHLRARRYVRYVDDFVILHESPAGLNAMLAHISQWLPQHLHVQLNPRKTILQPVDRGIDFVGHVVKPWRRTTRRRTVQTALARIRTIDSADVYTTGNSYLGLAGQASHGHTDQARIAAALRRRGHVVAGDLSKIYR